MAEPIEVRVIMAQRSDTKEQWEQANPILEKGEIGFVVTLKDNNTTVDTINTGLFKIGDGIRAWNNLPYASVGKQDVANDGSLAGTVFNDFSNNRAQNKNSIAEGTGTFTFSDNQHVIGKYNEKEKLSSIVNYPFIIGWGTSDTDRKNIVSIDEYGNTNFSGAVTSNGKELVTENHMHEPVIGPDSINILKFFDPTKIENPGNIYSYINDWELGITVSQNTSEPNPPFCINETDLNDKKASFCLDIPDSVNGYIVVNNIKYSFSNNTVSYEIDSETITIKTNQLYFVNVGYPIQVSLQHGYGTNTVTLSDYGDVRELQSGKNGFLTIQDKYTLDALSNLISNKLNLSGGTLTGPLYASSNPTSSMEVATKEYVDSHGGGGGGTSGDANIKTVTEVPSDANPNIIILNPTGEYIYQKGVYIYFNDQWNKILLKDENNNITSDETNVVSGENNIALGTNLNVSDGQTAFGSYNRQLSSYYFMIGNGTSNDDRNNLFAINKNGEMSTNSTVHTNQPIDSIVINEFDDYLKDGAISNVKLTRPASIGEWYVNDGSQFYGYIIIDTRALSLPNNNMYCLIIDYVVESEQPQDVKFKGCHGESTNGTSGLTANYCTDIGPSNNGRNFGYYPFYLTSDAIENYQGVYLAIPSVKTAIMINSIKLVRLTKYLSPNIGELNCGYVATFDFAGYFEPNTIKQTKIKYLAVKVASGELFCGAVDDSIDSTVGVDYVTKQAKDITTKNMISDSIASNTSVSNNYVKQTETDNIDIMVPVSFVTTIAPEDWSDSIATINVPKTVKGYTKFTSDTDGILSIAQGSTIDECEAISNAEITIESQTGFTAENYGNIKIKSNGITPSVSIKLQILMFV